MAEQAIEYPYDLPALDPEPYIPMLEAYQGDVCVSPLSLTTTALITYKSWPRLMTQRKL